MSEYDDEMVSTYKLLIDKEIIQFHCRRHGWIGNIFNLFPKEDQNKILRAIQYHNGNKSYWYSKEGVEFYDNTKVYPPGKTPWNWCGETVLFKDWQKREKRNRILANNFRLGDKVYFEHKGERIEGVVSHIGKRITVIIPNGKWYVPADELVLDTRSFGER
jgi:hypothetical protein